MVKATIILLVSFFLCNTVTAQGKEYILKNYTQEEGLPSNETYFIFEDSKHYLWIATDLGVARYDGSKFEKFSLPDNVIFKIKEDKKGRIWFFSHKGLLAYFQNEKIYPYRFNENIKREIDKIHIVDADVDDNDNIYISSLLDKNYILHANGTITGINHNYWGKQTIKFSITPVRNDQLFVQRYLSSHEKGDSMLITVNSTPKKEYLISETYEPFSHYGAIRNNKGDIFFFGEKMIIKLFPAGNKLVKKLKTNIISLHCKNGMLWAGMLKGGVVLLDENLNETYKIPILPGKSVSSICTDFEGGIWFSTTEEGIYYIKNPGIKHLAVNKEIPEADRIFNYKDSILIFANHSGLYQFADNTVERTINLESYSANNISDIQLPDEKTVFICAALHSGKAGFIPAPGKFFKKNYLYPSSHEAAFISRNLVAISLSTCCTLLSIDLFKSATEWKSVKRGKEYARFSSNEYALVHKPMSLFKDGDNNIWGCNNDGLYKCLPPYDTLLKVGKKGSIFENGISCIRQLQNGWMAAGIRFGGVAVFSNPDSVISITETNGLLSNKIRYLMPLNNQLWAATAEGISVIEFSSFTPVRYTIKTIGKNDGLYNTSINQLVNFKGDIAAATSNGLYFIEKPAAFNSRTPVPVPFYITTVSYYGGDTSNIKQIAVPYSKSQLVIRYNAVSFNSNEKIHYLYRFAINDTEWHSTTNKERVIENLSPGVYSLQLKAIIPETNRSSEIKTFTITIQKPWWQNNWFRLLVVLLTGAVIYLIVNSRIRKIQEEERKKTALNAKLTELEQTALRSQMNPHFIFNCLTSIQQLIISGQKNDANEYLVKFARLIRKTLELSAQPFISITEEKQYLGEYLLLEQLRLNGKFDYTITADTAVNTDLTLIPNMMVQPVIENCVRHGIKPLEGRKGLITVHFTPAANGMLCTVTDNGVGRNSINAASEKILAYHKSYGIDIVRKRLETFAEFNLNKNGMEIKDLFDPGGIPSGTQVILQLPIKTLYDKSDSH